MYEGGGGGVGADANAAAAVIVGGDVVTVKGKVVAAFVIGAGGTRADNIVVGLVGFFSKCHEN